MDTLFLQAGSWLGLIGSIGLTLVTYVAKKYIIPFLQVGKHQKYAELIARLAEDITDDLVEKYPENTWLQHLDDAVETLIDILGIPLAVAKRAIQAAATRKKHVLQEIQ